MEPFAEKLTDNLAGLYFILYQVRGASTSGGASHNSVQFAEVNYRIQCLFKSTFTSLKLNRLYNLKLRVFKLLGERTNHSESE